MSEYVSPLLRRRVGPGNFTLSLSQIPYVNLSIHTARAIARRLPPSLIIGFLPLLVDPIQLR